MDTAPYIFIDRLVELFDPRTLTSSFASRLKKGTWRNVLHLHRRNRRYYELGVRIRDSNIECLLMISSWTAEEIEKEDNSPTLHVETTDLDRKFARIREISNYSSYDTGMPQLTFRQDEVDKVGFTDVDYHVVSDAGRLVVQGKSPFERATYRYTPILSWMMVPNVLFYDCGKIIFSLFDILVGWLGYEIAFQAGTSGDEAYSSRCTAALALWLFFPVTAVVSTRGNADVVICAAVMLSLYLLERKRIVASALVYGCLAVQFKIYPIIYLPSIFLSLAEWPQPPSKASWKAYAVALVSNWRGYLYTFVALASCSSLVAVFYFIYGWTYLDESLLYHFKRVDIRHNFSPYHLLFYLSYGGDATFLRLIGTLAFLPQCLLVVAFAFRFYHDLPFCWFISTVAFVAFNKVCTSQYFIWYLCFIPVIHRSLKMVFYLIGLGLADANDITVRGLEAARSCTRIYLEAYTSILCYGLDKSALEAAFEKQIIEADRDMVEQNSDEILAGAAEENVAMLVVGDPFGATTHSDLVLRCKEKKIPVRVVHNASIMNAVGCSGLQLYSFGEAVSIVMWTDSWQPDSYYDRIKANMDRGLHTLCLLDIKVKEQTVENMMRKRKIYEPPRYMTCAEAANQLITISDRRKAIGEEPSYNADSMCVGMARVGWDDQLIVYSTLREMAEMDMGRPLHCLLLPGKTHPLEEDMLNSFRP
ncbi:hypothetical protein QR680_014197 [Steinernema hermaphroditum]|uniref:diphthine methyl ester synthase n=1 Tax=Steinernema hermaphroditum TaxID=289476 RepID=A0AA39M2S7_9BILA|nr:hypothetical protein QR680_014197 [Steinernema hermaphroditum]